jgi:hypothetical protein
LDGHPRAVAAVAFNQKDSAFADLAGELGAVGKFYYQGSTISESMALDNVASQLASEEARDLWTSLARNKRSASNEIIVAAWTRIRGVVSADTLRSRCRLPPLPHH